MKVDTVERTVFCSVESSEIAIKKNLKKHYRDKFMETSENLTIRILEIPRIQQ